MPRPVSNPPNPWSATHVEWLGPPPPARLEIFEELAKSALTKNDSPDISFRFGLNPYRGCQHSCAYCYARPTHEYLGFGAGTDFDSKIVVKTNIAEVLRRELERRSWKGDPVMLSGNTDCYQPLEAVYRLTRSCLEACRDLGNPVGIITKSALVRRDIDLLSELARTAGARVFLSIPFADADVARRVEPAAPTPGARFDALKALSDAGVECGVAIAPLIPALNESQVPEILERARDAGARSAFMTLVHLSPTVEGVFRERIERAFPDRAAKVFAGLTAMRGGHRTDTRFGERMRGRGPRWDSVARLFAIHARRLGLATGDDIVDLAPLVPAARRTPVRGRHRDARGQGALFS